MSRPYRSLWFNDERKWKSNDLLDDVLQVGKQKAIGYVIENTTYLTKEFDMRALAEQLYAENKLIRIVEDGDMLLLWAGDSAMMRIILDKNKELIEKNGWPLEPESFFDRISSEDIDHHDNPDMYHVVCDLFNSWCLHCEIPIRKQFVDGSIKYISAHPYDPDKK